MPAAGRNPADALIAHTLARATLEAGLPAADLFERASRLAPGDAAVWLGHMTLEGDTKVLMQNHLAIWRTLKLLREMAAAKPAT